MSKPVLIKQSFNGGELAPEIHYSDRLEVYQDGCKQLENMLVTPRGGVIKRPPTELLAKIDDVTYGVPIRYLPFRFSEDEVYHIIITDGTGSASPTTNPELADIIIFDADGNIQQLDTDYILSTPYEAGDVVDIHHMQINDFIYMTCASKYPVQYINRYLDNGSFKWKFEEFELSLGPFDTVNIDGDHTLTLNVADYDAGTTYSKGDIVKGTVSGGGGDVVVTHIQWDTVVYGSSDSVKQAVVLTATPHGLSPGDNLTLVGCNHTLDFYSGGSKVGDTPINTLDGSQTVSNVYSENCFAIHEYIGAYKTGDFSIHTDGNDWDTAMSFPNPHRSTFKEIAGGYISSSGGSGDIEATYVSLVDNNIGNPLSDTSKWAIGGSTTGIEVAEATIESSKDMFESGDVGRLLAVVDNSDERKHGEWDNNNISNPVIGFGTVTLTTTGGAWGGYLELETSRDGINWETIGSIRSENGGYNGSIEREITDIKSQVRVKLTDWHAPSGTFQTEKCVWELKFSETIYQIFKIKEVTDAQNAVVETVTPLLTSSITSNWKLGEFSPSNGYPATLAIHNERMVFGGSYAKPNTVWASRTFNWNEFVPSALATSPFSFTIASDSYDKIQWIRNSRDLMFGTDQSEGILKGQNSQEAITATNVKYEPQTRYGSSNIQAVVTADLIFFVQGQNRRVRSSQYDYGTDQFQASEVSEAASHLTLSGIKEMSFRRHPWSTLFFVLNNGEACSFTYDRDNEVKGWARFTTDGEIISAQSNYSTKGDIIAGIMKRGDDYTLEQFGTADTNTVYLDSQEQWTDTFSSGVNLNADIDLDNPNIVFVANDKVLDEGTDYTLVGDLFTAPSLSADTTLTVGYPFDAVVNPTDITAFSPHGKYKRITHLAPYVLDTGDFDIQVNGNDVNFTHGLRLNAGERLHGDQPVSANGSIDEGCDVKIISNNHQPLNLIGLGYKFTD